MDGRITSAALGALLLMACPGLASAEVQGVDVSYYQGSIDWPRVHAAGIGFGITRCSDGLGFRDPTFARNWNAMRANGIVRGVYQFFRPNQDPIAQADLLISMVGSFGPGDLPPVCDLEVTGGMSAATISARVGAWVNRIRSRTGMTPIIYTAPGFWNPLHASTAGATLWVAHWGVSHPMIPAGWGSWVFWQYSSTGSVPGIPARVDRDVFYGSLAELQAYARGGHVTGGTGGGGGGGSSGSLLRLGSSGPTVAQLQRLLAAKGFNPGPIDGSFGPQTLAAVRAFQAAHGLTVDGVVGPHTWAALNAAAPSHPTAAPPPPPASTSHPTLRQGSRGGAVVTLQQLLARKGFNPGPADGDFGPRTNAAVRAFQLSRHLAVDGIVGPITWAALLR